MGSKNIEVKNVLVAVFTEGSRAKEVPLFKAYDAMDHHFNMISGALTDVFFCQSDLCLAHDDFRQQGKKDLSHVVIKTRDKQNPEVHLLIPTELRKEKGSLLALEEHVTAIRESPVAIISGDVNHGTHFEGTMERYTKGTLVLLVGCSAVISWGSTHYRTLVFTDIVK